MKHRRILIALTASALTVVYAAAVLVNRDFATAVGVGYIVVILTLRVVWHAFDA